MNFWIAKMLFGIGQFLWLTVTIIVSHSPKFWLSKQAVITQAFVGMLPSLLLVVLVLWVFNYQRNCSDEV